MSAAMRLSRWHTGLTATNPSVAALVVRDGAIVGATTSDDCDGIAVVRLDEAATIGCVTGDPATPTAVALTGSSVGVWNGDAVTPLRR